MAMNSQVPKLYTALSFKTLETLATSSLPDGSFIVLECKSDLTKSGINRCK